MLGLPKALLGTAAVLSLVTSGLVYTYMKDSAKGLPAGMEQVVVAAKEIPARTAISPDMLKVANLPADVVQQGAAKQVENLIGSIAKTAIGTGDQVTDKKVAIPGQPSNDLILSIPQNKRAFTVSVDGATDGAVVKAGDYVDLAVTLNGTGSNETVSSLLLQNVLVLASGGHDKKDAVAEKRVPVTVAVSPDEAAALALVADKGMVHLVLRPVKATPSAAVKRSITVQDIVGAPPTPISVQQVAAPQAPVMVVPAPVEASSGGITLIRGTKQETVNLK